MNPLIQYNRMQQNLSTGTRVSSPLVFFIRRILTEVVKYD